MRFEYNSSAELRGPGIFLEGVCCTSFCQWATLVGGKKGISQVSKLPILSPGISVP